MYIIFNINTVFLANKFTITGANKFTNTGMNKFANTQVRPKMRPKLKAGVSNIPPQNALPLVAPARSRHVFHHLTPSQSTHYTQNRVI
jgi:hypothetical protein